MNKLTIEREIYEGVTDMPHFPLSIKYEGCCIEIEDLYFGDLKLLSDSVERLEQLRKGEVHIDAGRRFSATLSLDSHGALEFRFRLEPSTFPGRLLLEGHFKVDGEYTGQYLISFLRLINEGRPFSIEHPASGGPS